MHLDDKEEKLLRSVALQNAKAVLVARERAERELVEANQRITNILDSITDAFVALDRDWRFVFVNRRADEIFRTLGKSRESVLGVSHWEVFPATVGTAVDENYRRAMREQVTVEFEHHYAPSDSWFNVRAYPSPEGLSIYFQNITQRKRDEETVRESEERLRGIFNQAAVGIAVAGMDGRLLEVNCRFAEILGYSPEELRARTAFDVTHPEHVGQTRELLQRLVKGELPRCVIEKRYRRKDDSEVWSRTTVTVVRDASGEPQRFIAVVEDISERKSAEDELRISRQRLQLAFQAGGLGDWEWDPRTDLVTLGERTAEIFGVKESTITWTAIRELLHEEDRERARLSVEQALANRTDYHIDYRVVRPSGEVVWVAARGRGNYAPDGTVQGMTGVVADITERKRAEEARSRLAAVVESSDDAIISMDLQANITTWNKGAERTLGYTAAEVVGRPITLLIPAGREDEEPAILERLKRGERIDHYETERVRKDGTHIHVSLSVSPIFGADGRIVGVSKISRDVTARRETEEKLRRSEEELRALADSIPQMAWMATPDGHIFWYNRRWYEYTGTTFEQMEGWGWQSVHDPEMLPSVIERWKNSLSTGEPFDMEFPLRGADGVFRWFLTRVNPLRDSAGNVVRWFGTNTNVDAVRRAQEALREETRVLELLNDTGRAIAANLDLQTLVQMVTDAATKLSGAKFGAFFYNVVNQQGESLVLYTLSGAPREAFDKFGHPRATPLFGPTFRGEGPVRVDDVLQDPRYGQMPPHHGMPKGHLPVRSYLAVPVISRSGEVIGGLFFGHPDKGVFTERTERLIVGVAAQAAVAIDNARLYDAAQREIAERIRVAEELRKAQEELSQHAEGLEQQVEQRTASLRETIGELEAFSYSISHDLRAPLRAMQGFASILSEECTDQITPEGREYIRRITAAAERMDRLIQDVLTYSRVSRRDVILEVVDTHQLVRDILDSYPALQRPTADIDIEGHLPPVLATEAVLTQCISNLLGNAVKFVSRSIKPRVRIWAEPAPNPAFVRIHFRDNGLGINRDAHELIFGMFQRLDKSYEGTGIGLAIVKKGVERMGGRVRLESEPGRGSTFTLELRRAGDAFDHDK